MYQFDQIIDRRGYSSKWDKPLYPVAPDKPLIPMWIADMDFATPPCVTDAIRQRLEHPTFGYCDTDPRFAQAVVDWARARRGVTDLKPEYVQCQNSTVGAIVAAIKTLTQPGEGVLVHLPNYTGFTYGIADAGRRLVGTPLVRDEQGVFRMDLADMEEKIRAEKIRCLILCSPHNPTGRVWTRQELEQVSELCEKYGVYIISDEVWADFVFAPARQIATALATDYTRSHTIATYGATKTFNLAGLRAAYSIVYDDQLRAAYQKKSAENHYNVPNTLSVAAVIGAYTGGGEYADQLVAYIYENMKAAHEYIRREIPQVASYLPEGTYTLWLDFGGTGLSDEEAMKRMGAQGLVMSPASEYNGSGWFRMNMACPRSQVEQALKALKAALA